MSKSSIWTIERTQLGAKTPGQSRPGDMALKGYSAFIEAPALPEPHHQIFGVITWKLIVGGFIPQQRYSQYILLPSRLSWNRVRCKPLRVRVDLGEMTRRVHAIFHKDSMLETRHQKFNVIPGNSLGDLKVLVKLFYLWVIIKVIDLIGWLILISYQQQ